MNTAGAVLGKCNFTHLLFCARRRIKRARTNGAEGLAMTEHPAANAQTPIVIRASDADRATNLAIAAEDRLPQVAALLLRELNRAEVIPDAEMPADIVAMQATVEFIDEASGVERTLQLVYPTEADFDASRISILSLVGAGILGLKAGQSIMWPDRAGKEQALRIIDVMQG